MAFHQGRLTKYFQEKGDIQQNHADPPASIGDVHSARQWDCQAPCRYERLYCNRSDGSNTIRHWKNHPELGR